jgi:hypothetical protein
VSDKTDDIARLLSTSLKPEQLRLIIDNLSNQAPAPQPTPYLDKMLEDVIERALIPTKDDIYYWHVEDEFFECFVDSRDAQTKEDAMKFAFDAKSNQPWYPKVAFPNPRGIAEQVSSKQFRKWLKRE